MLRFVLFLAAAAAAIWLVLLGPLAGPVQALLQPAGRWLLALQAGFQTDMARQLRGVHAGQSAAFWGLMAVCASYGFLHAAGPGHGKALVGAYGVARRLTAVRLAGIGLLAALAQATVAVALVLGLAGLAGLGRAGIEEVDRGLLAGLSLAAMGAIGLWLLWRALARVSAAGAPAVASGHGHHHAPGAPCESCGHAHLPPARAMLQAATPREVAALIAAVAVRPCSGALILLLLTWQMGFLWVGVAGAYAMALGTAAVTVTVALALVLGREGLLRAAGGLAERRALWIGSGIEAVAGLVLLLGVLAVVAALR